VNLDERLEKARPVDLTPAIRIAIELRDAQDERSAAEERLKEVKDRVTRLSEVELVDVFDSLGIDHVGVPPSGNRPGFDVTVGRFYEASIPQKWDEEQRERAFDLLERFGHGGLIKSQVTVEVPMGSIKLLHKLIDFISKLGLTPIVKKGVHHGTLTAWLREEDKSGRKMPPLTEIGAYIGRRGKIKERTD
jgi:hypothetical protein